MPGYANTENVFYCLSEIEAFVIKTYWDLKKLKYEKKTEMNSGLGSKKKSSVVQLAYYDVVPTARKRMQSSHVKVKNVITGHN